MNSNRFWIVLLVVGAMYGSTGCESRQAAEGPKPPPQAESADVKSDRKIELGEEGAGRIVIVAPDSWVRKAPQNRIVEHEFAIPAAKGDTEDGRITVMGAGGTVEQNIDRWIGQFKQPDGSETKNQITEAERKQAVAGIQVLKVDLSGTYHDAMRPFDPHSDAVDRENYRMLAAVISTPKSGNYFIKFYGPSKTVADHADEFWKAIGALKAKEK